MSGTKEGGLKAAAKIREKHGTDFYREIGRIGGRNGNTGGFAANHELAKLAGCIGGMTSRRGWKLIEKTKKKLVFQNKKTGEIDVKKIG